MFSWGVPFIQTLYCSQIHTDELTGVCFLQVSQFLKALISARTCVYMFCEMYMYVGLYVFNQIND